MDCHFFNLKFYIVLGIENPSQLLELDNLWGPDFCISRWNLAGRSWHSEVAAISAGWIQRGKKISLENSKMKVFQSKKWDICCHINICSRAESFFLRIKDKKLNINFAWPHKYCFSVAVSVKIITADIWFCSFFLTSCCFSFCNCF